MNKNTRILLILVLLLGAAWFLISRQPWKNADISRKEFAIEDTAGITKIFIADRNNHRVLLQQSADGIWTVNGNEPADQQKINLIKTTLHDIEVRNPVTEKEFNRVVADLGAYGVKTEIYKGEELLKTFYVGEATAEGTGTFMIIEGSKTPYVTHIPGFIGYLTPRFIPNPVKWKSKLVFDASPEIISSIRISYPSHPEASFAIQRNHDTLTVTNLNGKLFNADLGFTKYYISSFTNLFLEGYADEITPQQEDSILAIKPFCVLELKRQDGKNKKLTVTFKGVDQRTKERYDQAGNPLDHDGDKFFARVDDEHALAYIQQYNFGKLFRRLQDFSASAH